MARILLVDDDQNFLNYCSEELRALGYEVLSAIDGQEACAQLIEIKPDVIVMDVSMPLMDGVSLLYYVRMRYPTVGVILHSAHPEYAHAYETWSANAFVEKTGDVSDLQRALCRLLKLQHCEVG